MKELILLFLAGTGLATAHAQIQFGVKAGANFSNLAGSDVSGTGTTVDFHAGALVKIPLVKQFSVQPEVLYSGQGAKANMIGTSYTSHLNYINVPVLFKYDHASGFFAETGPQFGFLLSANVKSGGVNQTTKSEFKSTDFSWAFGAGYLFNYKSAKIGIDARYNLGLVNIENKVRTGGNGTIKNSVIQVGVFYLFL